MLGTRSAHTLTKITARSFSTVVNVNEASAAKVAKKIQESTLSNGTKVVTITGGDFTPVVSVGVFVGSGSKDETRDTLGAAHFLKHLTFESTARLPNYEHIREFERIGSSPLGTAGRESISYTAKALANDAQTLTRLVYGLRQPRLAFHEVERTRRRAIVESTQLESDSSAYVSELLHREAYRYKGLGNPLTPPAFRLEHLNNELLASFVNTHYVAKNTVVVGVGIEHRALLGDLELIERGSPSRTSETEKPKVASKYIGGQNSILTEGNTHVALGFEGFAANNSKDLLVLNVLSKILGGGSIYSYKEGVGRGVTSRLHKNIVGKNPWALNVDTFSKGYSDSGLFGFYGIAQPGHGGSLVDSLAREAARLVKGDIQQAELDKAKAQLKSDILSINECSSSTLTFIAEQALKGSQIISPEEAARSVDSISLSDVNRVAQRVLSTNPTLVAVGDVTDIPTLSDVKSKISK
eukprot:TRINITY_DN1827_c0_g3_i1.p1 TRINITY_DN1827_c0_g3~~TRINITY_DN1827_c0_g3_i1.p1  ORF type:complete len:505 (-),score=116.83 TRINITY_DN1827_c0_g3_i1:105-1508(-)